MTKKLLVLLAELLFRYAQLFECNLQVLQHLGCGHVGAGQTIDACVHRVELARVFLGIHLRLLKGSGLPILGSHIDLINY